jgi:hypothetical protein
MEIYKYRDYDHYIKVQKATTAKKSDWVYAREEVIQQISEYKGFSVRHILCHGSRAAGEQKFFKKYYPMAEIIGTEIADTALNYPMTVEWDFNKQNPEWIGKFDIVYSNAIDHSITPNETIGIWKQQLKPNGTLCLEYAETQSRRNNDQDPVYATDAEIVALIINNGMIINHEIRNKVKHAGIVFCCEVGEL